MSDKPQKRICVYCGSGAGANPIYEKNTQIFGKSLAKANIGLVYGGGNLGLMGMMAQSVLNHGGHVTGIIPEFLKKSEIMNIAAQELIVTNDMHERKRLMFENSDGFVALPGGIGTLEELVEQLTWAQLGRHNKPICLANFDNFWSPLLDLIDHMKSQEFIRAGLDFKLHIIDQPEDILPKMLGLLEKVEKSAEPTSSDILEKM